MTLIIVILLLCGYLLIATGHLTGVNKAAIAMFLGTVGWVLYICWGADFVMSQHPREYACRSTRANTPTTWLVRNPRAVP